MALSEHLEELRKTLINIMAIVGLSFFIAYAYGDMIAHWMIYPLKNSLQGVEEGKIVYLGLLDKIMGQLQVAFWASIILSSPLWFWQIWRFIRPGLHLHEIKVIRPFLFLGFVLFCLGVSFGYFLVFPLTFEVLLHFGLKDIEAMISFKDYLILACKVLVFLGLAFQLPNVVLILGFMGLVTKYSLRQMRRYVYFALAVLAALLTPPDPYTLLGLWLPLVVLFEVGIGMVALIVHPYLARQHREEES